MDIRRLGPADGALGVQTITRLKGPDGYPTPSTQYVTKFLSRPDNVLIVATDQGIAVGFIIAYLLDRVDRDQQTMFFYEIGVAESHRRRGVGTQMIETLKRVCRTADVMKMWVPTGRSNIAATRLYARTGAVPVSGNDEVTYAYSPETWTAEGGLDTDDH
jgi:aminoglycoside 3-N-acetyltransferase I